jgi:hypothetical protein
MGTQAELDVCDVGMSEKLTVSWTKLSVYVCIVYC